jgi:hypothetical protein
MKKIISILLTCFILAGCAETNTPPQARNELEVAEIAIVQVPSTTATTTTQTPQTTMTEPATTTQAPKTTTETVELDLEPGPILGNRYLDKSMPSLTSSNSGEPVGSDSRFYRKFPEKLDSVCDSMTDVFKSNGYRNLYSQWEWKWCLETYTTFTSLMDFPNHFSIIVANNIPDSIVIKSYEERNALYKMLLEEGVISNSAYKSIVFSPEDISVLLSRCEATVLAHFASPYAIVIGDRIYSPAWVYRNTTEGYRVAGITQKMIQEKLPTWREFGMSGETATAFEKKLTEFTGQNVKLQSFHR